MNDAFSEGITVIYKHHVGVIRFVSEQYITLCVRTFPEEKNRDVCILIYRDNYKNVKLLKESEK